MKENEFENRLLADESIQKTNGTERPAGVARGWPICVTHWQSRNVKFLPRDKYDNHDLRPVEERHAKMSTDKQRWAMTIHRYDSSDEEQLFSSWIGLVSLTAWERERRYSDTRGWWNSTPPPKSVKELSLILNHGHFQERKHWPSTPRLTVFCRVTARRRRLPPSDPHRAICHSLPNLSCTSSLVLSQFVIFRHNTTAIGQTVRFSFH